MKTLTLLRFSYLLGLFSFLIFSNSCATRGKLVYFQGEEPISDSTDYTFKLKYEVGDIISIDVSGPDPEVVAPFNQAKLEKQGSNQFTSYENGAVATYGYLIQADSTVSLPIVGKVKIAGLESIQAIDSLEIALSEYVTDAAVSIKLLNFKITVLGEVRNPGTFAIPNERVTVIEAIGIAKDLHITGERKNVLVIRHVNGKKLEYRIDLTTKDLFNSPAYYLKQNDIIYVEPNRSSRFNSTIVRSTGGIVISTASLIISTMVVIFNK